MKNFNNYKFALFGAFILTTASFYSEASNSFDISDRDLNSIENKVDSMNYKEMISTRSSLLAEQSNLEESQENTQSPAQNKSINERLKAITAELSTIQRALLVLAGAGVVSALTSRRKLSK